MEERAGERRPFSHTLSPFLYFSDTLLGLLSRVQCRLFNSFNKEIRRHVRAIAARPLAFLGPRIMAILTIILSVHQPELRCQTHRQVRREELPSELRIIHLQGLAFRASNRVTQCVL